MITLYRFGPQIQGPCIVFFQKTRNSGADIPQPGVHAQLSLVFLPVSIDSIERLGLANPQRVRAASGGGLAVPHGSRCLRRPFKAHTRHVYYTHTNLHSPSLLNLSLRIQVRSPVSVTTEVLVLPFAFARCTFGFECMTVDTLLEPGTRNVTTFRYCTTCKRFLEHVRFNFKRKTCSVCLLKSRDRARLRRRKLEFGDAKMLRQQLQGTLVKLKAAGRRKCSSCKVAKAPPSFAAKRKTCKTCLVTRRRRRSYHLIDRLQHPNVASRC